MKVYWIKAQAPRRILALLKHLGADAELIEVDMMAGGFQDTAYVALNPRSLARRYLTATVTTIQECYRVTGLLTRYGTTVCA